MPDTPSTRSRSEDYAGALEEEVDRLRKALQRIASTSTFQPAGVLASAIMRGIAKDALDG